jgi:murein DD-endopeptidase MepM/ murein hydrolase activator NlpD
MKKSHFAKTQVSGSLFLSSKAIAKAVLKCLKVVFAKRTILIVTDKKIRSINFGLISQVVILSATVWVGNLFLQTLRYNELIVEKSDEISRLRSVNSYFEEEIVNINQKLEKVSEYFSSVNGFNQNVKAKEIELKKPKNFDEEDLSRKDKGTFNQIKEASRKMLFVQAIAEDRIKKIEEVIAMTGLNIKKMPLQALKKKAYDGEGKADKSLETVSKYAQGGPSEENITENVEIDEIVNKSASNEDLERNLDQENFANEIDYLVVLEKIVQVMPLGKPMKNYFISSGFGARSDPFHKGSAMHKGLDFVGVTNEKIISPSQGKVILAGKFSNYGNAIVIDHGFGLTTRYGHLSEVKVKEGQIVKKGDIIALQGSTGRSTGAHLHYEVRYKNTPINPKRFLEAGNSLFKDNNLRHVSS